ncbi:MAG: hypothetical protein ABUK01_07850 [Leptospirales bacterium]
MFSDEYVTLLGSAKMDKIISGIYKIEVSNLPPGKQKKLIAHIMSCVDHTLSVGESEDIITKETKVLK